MRVTLICLCLLFPLPAQAQSVRVAIAAQTEDNALSFAGTARISLSSRQGQVTGTLHDGTACLGTAQVTRRFDGGGGQMRCDNGLSDAFEFDITSRLPIRGRGAAQLSDGRRARGKIGR